MINCIAIDDETLSLDLLEDNIHKVSFLNLVKKCSTVAEAMDVMSKQKVDLIFSDIEMPDINGLQMIKGLAQKPMIVFITAYDKYAMQGYELDVLDYLLKPVSFDRFLKAANKALEYTNYTKNKQTSSPAAPGDCTDCLFVRSEHRIIRIQLSDIQYIEALKDYVKIVTAEKPILSLMSLKHLEEILPSSTFIRVHRSFIVAIQKISYISRSKVFIETAGIPVSNYYREGFFGKINLHLPEK